MKFFIFYLFTIISVLAVYLTDKYYLADFMPYRNRVIVDTVALSLIVLLHVGIGILLDIYRNPEND